MKNDLTDYYGTDGRLDTISYLEFGSLNIKEGKKKIWGYWQDSQAYDLYMFSRYARDLFLFRKFLEESKPDIKLFNQYVLKSAHVKILDYIFKYSALIASLKITRKDGMMSVCESGSSLYGLIDEAAALDNVFHQGKNRKSLEDALYIASDISDMMNQGARAFHPSIQILASTAPTIGELLEEIPQITDNKLTLFYGLGVSMRYALRESRDIANVANICQLSAYNRLSVTGGKTYRSVYGTGKMAYIISLSELLEQLGQDHLFAKFYTESIQTGKDGEGSIRASIIIAGDGNHIDTFVEEYESCMALCGELGIVRGKWLPLEYLTDYLKVC